MVAVSGVSQIEHNTHNKQPTLSRYNHAPRLANHNRRTWLSSHDTPAASAPSGEGIQPISQEQGVYKTIFLTGLRIPFRYTYYIKNHGDMPRNYV
jgi:hypothetical protein